MAIQSSNKRNILLLVSVFIIAVCGLVYELLAAALSSYLIGDSVTNFSLVIGIFMFAMGFGSYLSRFVKRNPLTIFIALQIVIGITGGFSALLLFWAFTFLPTYLPYLFITSFTVGTLVGLEIPLVVRILKEEQTLSVAISSVLALDYVGALFASIIFPIVLLPNLGLIRSGFLFGLLNVAVAALALWRISAKIEKRFLMQILTILGAVFLFIGFFTAGNLTSFAEDYLYQDEIIIARDTPLQRIVVTRWQDDIRLYLNGQIQFSTVDEARYHESLVHPLMSSVSLPSNILILGGGDGLAIKEVLKYPHVKNIDLVDIDSEVTNLFKKHSLLKKLNNDSLNNNKVKIHNVDAAKFLEKTSKIWQAIIIDLPDPSSPSLARLYSKSFYRLLSRRLSKNGSFVTQATSPFYAPNAFWCIVNTIKSVRNFDDNPEFEVYPFHINVPSFGEWGFALASRKTLDINNLKLKVPTKFLNQNFISSLFVFPKDLKPKSVEINSFDKPILVHYYEKGWHNFNN